MLNLYRDRCRCCLGGDFVTSIFELKNEQYNKKLSEMITACSSHTVTEDDNLPQFICQQCIQELEQAFAFRTKCNETYEMLQNLLQVSVKDSKKQFKVNHPVEELEDAKTEEINVKLIKLEVEDDDHFDSFETNCLDDQKEDNKDSIGQGLDIDDNVNSVDANCNIFETKRCSVRPGKLKLVEPITIKVAQTSRTCGVCRVGFLTKSELKQHMAASKGCRPKKMLCEICNKYFKNEKTHKKCCKLKGKYPLVCKTCNIAVSSKHKLKIHMLKHSASQEHKCDQCSASFRYNSQLLIHRGVHGEKPYSCKFCGTKVTTKYHLTVHERVHTGEKPYPCHVCDEAFPTGSRRNCHLATHIDDENVDQTLLQTILSSVPFKNSKIVKREKHACHQCDKQFVEKKSLKLHVASIHLGVKDYFCELCKKFYASKKKHVSYHKYLNVAAQCPVCQSTLKNRHSLRIHMEVHSKDKKHVCECGASFRQYAGLYKHKRTHRKREFICHFCSKEFVTKYQLSIHLTTHTLEKTFACDLCPKKFSSGHSLKIHKLRHGTARDWKCELCDKDFKTAAGLQAHKLTHTKDRKFACKVCDRRFYRSDHRNNHEFATHKIHRTKPQTSTAETELGLNSREYNE